MPERVADAFDSGSDEDEVTVAAAKPRKSRLWKVGSGQGWLFLFSNHSWDDKFQSRA